MTSCTNDCIPDNDIHSEECIKGKAVCKNCGEYLKYNGILWVDKGLIFPQYCSASKGGRLHTVGRLDYFRDI